MEMIDDHYFLNIARLGGDVHVVLDVVVGHVEGVVREGVCAVETRRALLEFLHFALVFIYQPAWQSVQEEKSMR